ncbi:hypothetical protein [Paenarthrobacter nitroguajacolicus]|uniref:hypothetical protein n=1 Tax=Paenarthrobacter nitroguajacolicus TaxID=211146 RepID=UPI0015BF041F|nr:hypothetical protein [Paenarthrobacter nitroguajacolicus]NWL34467.1 hypothetical protein [Paenarthrobacter nitroguajacolicus]
MTAPDIPALLEPIQNRLNAATPGPWSWDDDHWLEGVSGGYVLSNDSVLEKNRIEPVTVSPDNAVFIANAPMDQARLLAAVQAVTGIAEIKMNSEHGDPAFVQGWECALEEMNARLVAALGGEA